MLFGFGLIAVGVPAQIAAVADVRHDEAGAASGLVTAGFQVGGALGIAIITTLANTRVGDALAAGMPRDDALVSGFYQGLMWATIFMLQRANRVGGVDLRRGAGRSRSQQGRK